jgi:lysophospholipase L1-like esterase
MPRPLLASCTLVAGLVGLLTALFVTGAPPAAAASPPPGPATRPGGEPAAFLPGVTRILFLGDSITYAGQYVDDVETHLRLRLPGRRFDVVNCGVPSETVSGLSEAGHAGGKFPRPTVHERLDRVLAKVKPDLVVVCYGMNDGIYLPLADDRFAAFRDGMTKLHEKAAAAGAQVLHVTPPVFDPVPIKAKVAAADRVDADHPFAGYDDVLAAYGRWLLDRRRAAGWRVVDLHGPMAAAIADRRTADPAFTFSKDGVHPDAAGHAVMAAAVLRGLDAPFDPADRAFGDLADPASTYSKVRKLVRDRGRVMTDAWLTETGHQRPGMKKGMPMEQAKEKAAAMEREIEKARGRGQ